MVSETPHRKLRPEERRYIDKRGTTGVWIFLAVLLLFAAPVNYWVIILLIDGHIMPALALFAFLDVMLLTGITGCVKQLLFPDPLPDDVYYCKGICTYGRAYKSSVRLYFIDGMRVIPASGTKYAALLKKDNEHELEVIQSSEEYCTILSINGKSVVPY